MKVNECIVLAGGLGTRLGELTKNTPKPLISVNGIPFIFYILDYLFLNGISKIVISVSYLKDHFIDLIPTTYRGIQIIFSVESRPLGTGGAIINSLRYIYNDYFYVVNADTYINATLDVYEKFLSKNNQWDILCGLKYLNDTRRYGRVELEHSKITKFREKDSSSAGYINSGYYLINKNKFNHLTPNFFSFEESILQSENYIKYGISLDGLFVDIGTQGSLIESEKILSDFRKNKAVFIDRDGTINNDQIGYTHLIKDFQLIKGVIEGLKIIQEKGYKIIIISNQSGVARGKFTISQMNEFNEYLVNELEKVGIIINDIFSCPHHPQGVIKEYSFTCGCRKPSMGLITEASIKHNIDLNYSYMVGNTLIDMETGRNAKLKSILITDQLTNLNDEDNDYLIFKSLADFAVTL